MWNFHYLYIGSDAFSSCKKVKKGKNLFYFSFWISKILFLFSCLVIIHLSFGFAYFRHSEETKVNFYKMIKKNDHFIKRIVFLVNFTFLFHFLKRFNSTIPIFYTYELHLNSSKLLSRGRKLPLFMTLNKID